MERGIVSPPMVFLGLGAVLGKLGWLDSGGGLLEGLTELTLVLVLFTDAVRIDLAHLRLQVTLGGGRGVSGGVSGRSGRCLVHSSGLDERTVHVALDHPRLPGRWIAAPGLKSQFTAQRSGRVGVGVA